MQENHSTTPLQWAQAFATTLQWPAVATAAFVLGRYIRGLEHRLEKAELRVENIVEKHLPSIHRMLAEIRGLLIGMR